MTEKELYKITNQDNAIIFDKVFKKNFSSLMSKVYLWMTFALAITGVAAYSVANSVAIGNLLGEYPSLLLACAVAEFALVIALSKRINKLSLVQGTMLFILYSLLTGVTLSVVLLPYTEESIAKVFLVTAATFSAMAIYGYTTKKDLTSMGTLLLFGLIGLVIATVVNIFLKSTMLGLLVSYVGVVIFIALTACDTQKIKTMLLEASQYGDGEQSQKVALMGALSLYLDFINLFLYLVKIMGKKK